MAALQQEQRITEMLEEQAEAQAKRRAKEQISQRINSQRQAQSGSQGNGGSSSGGTIAAIGGAALVAGGLTWLLWPDAKGTIQPWAQGRNDGFGYAAGIQMRVAPCLSLRLYQNDGPTELRFTGAAIEFRW